MNTGLANRAPDDVTRVGSPHRVRERSRERKGAFVNSGGRSAMKTMVGMDKPTGSIYERCNDGIDDPEDPAGRIKVLSRTLSNVTVRRNRSILLLNESLAKDAP